MKYFTGCDAHKKYSVFTGIDEKCNVHFTKRVEHEKGVFHDFLKTLPCGTPIAVESTGNWYWIIDEIEKTGHQPLLVHAGKAKLMMGQINKTDKLDSKGLAMLLRNGTLPVVWIPPAEIRDQRELHRMRLVMVHTRTMLKNRIHATFSKYGINFDGISDIFGKHGRVLINKYLEELPAETKLTLQQELILLDQIEEHIKALEKRVNEIIKMTAHIKILTTMPGVGPILAVTIAFESGDISRFPDPQHFASYSGTVPRIHSSGGKSHYGRVKPDVNHYLKWAFIEAANVIVLNQNNMHHRHAVHLYQRIRNNKGHAKAVVAVARHLAEAAYCIMKRNEPYRERTGVSACSRMRH